MPLQATALDRSLPKGQGNSVLERVSCHSPGALQECIDTYGRVVWSLARRYTQTSADAEDATQEIFISLWQNAQRFDPAKGTEVAFIAMLARRRLVDEIRKRTSRLQTEPLTIEISETMACSVSAGVAQDSCDLDRVTMALRRMRPQYQTVLNLAFSSGLTQSEIASQLGMPLGTVKSMMRRGLVEIRDAITLVDGQSFSSAPSTSQLPKGRSGLRETLRGALKRASRHLPRIEKPEAGCTQALLAPAVS